MGAIKKSNLKHHRKFNSASKKFFEFCKTIAALRNPRNGCPWDLKQTHLTLRQYMLEEAYEAVEAASTRIPAKLCDELGDVLLQVVLNAQIAADKNQFFIADVIDAINNKMKRRHPHVFSPNKSDQRPTIDEVWFNWRAIKTKEAGKKSTPGYLDKIANSALPANLKAQKIGEMTSRIQFDWDHWTEVYTQFRSEVGELHRSIKSKSKINSAPSMDFIRELGDVYFTLAQLCRHIGIAPEIVAMQGNNKFLKRFKKMEDLARKSKINIQSATRHDLEKLWNLAKLSPNEHLQNKFRSP